MKRKLFALLLVAFIIVQTVQVFPFTAIAAGVSNDGYTLVSTAAELSNIRNNLTGRYRLTNDITLSGSFTPIGAKGNGKMFEGILDGAGYSISGLSVSASSHVGLFGFTSGATIKNLTIKSGSVTGTSKVSYAGSLVGYAKSSLVLENCKSYADVKGTDYVGGLVGYGTFTGAVINKCDFYGKASGSNNVGGIIGKLAADSSSAAVSTISGCRVIIDDDTVNQATKNQTERITGSLRSTGGIAGEIAVTTIKQCYTGIKVKGGAETGGIVGFMDIVSGKSSTVTDCYSTGDVYGNTDTGGIVGSAYPNATGSHTITRCYSTSYVHGTSQKTGGIVGENGSTNIYSSTANCVAINTEIRQAGTNKTTTGRIAGSGDNGYSNNIAKSDLPIYWANAKQTVSGGKHGTNISDSELQTPAPYVTRGWNFTDTWYFDHNISPYPLLGTSPPTVTLTIDDEPLEVGQSTTVRAAGMQSGDSVKTWTVLGDELTITPSGNTATVTGEIPGSVSIKAETVKGAIGTISVTVEPLIIDEPDALVVALLVGETCNLDGIIYDFSHKQQFNPAEMAKYVWSSSDSNIAEVNQNGKVTAKALGVATITATGMVTRSIDILVREPIPIPIEKIDFSYGADPLIADTAYMPILDIYPSDAWHRDLIWEVDGDYVAMITSSTGKLFASEPGIVTVRVSDAITYEVYGEKVFAVVRPITNVVIDAPKFNIDVGEEMDIGLIVTPFNALYSAVKWEYDNAIISIDSSNYRVKGEAAGTTTLTAIVTTDFGDKVYSTITIRVGPDFVVLANWGIDRPPSSINSLFYPHEGELKDDSFISGVGINSLVSNGRVMSAKGWHESSFSNPKAWMATIPAVGYTTFKVTYDQRANNPSPNWFTLEYSIDGGPWEQTGNEYQIRALSDVAGTFTHYVETINLLQPVMSDLRIRWRAGAWDCYGTNSRVLQGASSFLRDVVIEGQ